MAVTATPIFTQTPKNATANVTTADSAYDNPSTGQATIFTAGANGTKVFEIIVQQRQTTGVASIVRIFIGGTSTTGKLVDEFTKTSISASATVAGFRQAKQYDNFLVTASQLVICTVSATDNVNVNAWYGDF